MLCYSFSENLHYTENKVCQCALSVLLKKERGGRKNIERRHAFPKTTKGSSDLQLVTWKKNDF